MSACLSDGALSNTFTKVPAPVHVPVYPKKPWVQHCELQNDLPFLPERMKIEKVKKLVTNLHDKYVMHIRNLKQALDHGLVF